MPAVWDEIAEDVLRRASVVMSVGGTDSGKSSFAFWIARRAASQGRRPWIVDADVGQSDVGPPATIGASSIPARLPRAHDSPKPVGPLRASLLYFVGSISPRGHLLQMVTGTARAVDDAFSEGADLVVINTTGYVSDQAAVALKVHKIDLVRPDVLLAFGAPEPLAAILDPYRFTRKPRVVLCPSSPELRRRSPGEREEMRDANWRTYFADAARRVVLLERVGLSGEERTWVARNDVRGRILGLYAPSGACRAVGVVVRQSRGKFEVLTPLSPDVPIARLDLGVTELSPDQLL